MNGKRWKRSAAAVYNIGYHLIWCPKYRRKVLVGEVAERLKELLLQKAQQIEGEAHHLQGWEEVTKLQKAGGMDKSAKRTL